MPTVPSCIIEPLWAEVEALVGPDRSGFDPQHPLGCHRRPVPNRVVFEHLIEALVHGTGYERVASVGCSDRTIRRRLTVWAEQGVGEAVHKVALAAYDRIVGLDLDDLSVDGCVTKAPCGGDKAGPSPVDRRKGGLKRSTATDAFGVPIGLVSAGANRHDSPLLAPTLESASTQLDNRFPEQPTAHLDAGYDGAPSRKVLDLLGFEHVIASKGVPTPIQIGGRWVVERTNSWMNQFGKLRRCTDRNGLIVDFYLHLAAAIVTIRQLIQRARPHYRWPTRPTTRRLK